MDVDVTYHRVVNAPREAIEQAIAEKPLKSRFLSNVRVEVVDIPTDTRPDWTGGDPLMVTNGQPGLSLRVQATKRELSVPAKVVWTVTRRSFLLGSDTTVETIRDGTISQWFLSRRMQAERIAGTRPRFNRDPNLFFKLPGEK